MHVTFWSGDLQLEGELATSSNTTRAAVICHPHPLYGGNMDNNVVLAIEAGLGRSGHATLRFNFRGAGKSEGGYENGAGEQDDVRAAVAEVLRRTGCTSCTVAGYSFGAMITVMAGPRLESADRLIIVAPPLNFAGLEALSQCAKPKLFLVGDRDQYCAVGELEGAVGRLPEPKQTRILPGADHFFAGFEGEISEAVEAF